MKLIYLKKSVKSKILLLMNYNPQPQHNSRVLYLLNKIHQHNFNYSKLHNSNKLNHKHLAKLVKLYKN